MILNEERLLVGRELHHPEPTIRMKGGEDALVDPEVGLVHVRAFARTVESQRHAPETLCRHHRLATGQIVP